MLIVMGSSVGRAGAKTSGGIGTAHPGQGAPAERAAQMANFFTRRPP
jgi:hypothetical protein